MSMIGHLLRVSKTELEAYLNDSTLLEGKIYNNDSEDDENNTLVDIDKSWDGILFLLTGNSLANSYEHPLAKVLFSGQLIDEEQDLGYGPAHYLTPEQVVDLNNQISTLTEADLKKKYDPQKMTKQGVYPSVWQEGDDEEFGYLMDYFKMVQEVYSEAAKNGEAIITYVS